MPNIERLDSVLGSIGYEPNLRQHLIRPTDSDIEIDVVAFTTTAPQDIRTSAIAAFAYDRAPLHASLAAARNLATPFVIIETDAGALDLYHVTLDRSREILIERIASDEVDSFRTSELAMSLAPRAVHAAKTGVRQLSLFPVDARLLAMARDLSIHSIQSRMEASFARTLDATTDATTAARIVIAAVAALVARDKYRLQATELNHITDVVLSRHGSYFEDLQRWQMEHPEVLHDVFDELGTGVDYSTIDARSINSVYERVFLTNDLRRKLGIFHTDLRLATKILEFLPIEEIPPEERFVIDPACGSGNLLLAAIERLENLVPNDVPAGDVHQWMKTHIYGSDIEPIAVEVAKLSLLTSSLPHGNSWQIETRDAIREHDRLPFQPSIWVTNPPWQNAKGKRDDIATEFLNTAIQKLADGGMMACILPASWLSAKQHRHSRQQLEKECEVFEVWRLPRDMFAPDARFPAAVVFAKKSQTSQRRSHLYRWLTASKQHREEFLDRGRVQFQLYAHQSGTDGFVSSPLERLMTAETSLGDVAELSGGVVQRGTPRESTSGGVPYLPRGADVSIYRSIDEESLIPVDMDSASLLASTPRLNQLLQAPKLLIQADRFVDNSWRLRPVVDTQGIIPSNRWQVVSTSPQAVFALNALCASSIASCIVHSLATTMRISLDVLRQLPLPTYWHHEYEEKFAKVGRLMADPLADIEPLLSRCELLAREAYQLTAQEIDAVDLVMAGFEAPEGTIRVPEFESPVQDRPTHAVEFSQAPGTVLDVHSNGLRVWILGGPEDGYEIGLPRHMPGWLMCPGSTFELTGTLDEGRYRFHRTSYWPDEEVLGIRQ